MSSNRGKRVQVELKPETEESIADLEGYLRDKAHALGLKYLLSFHDDGVVWGRFDNGWKFSSDLFAVSPPFRALTLQKCLVFGPTAEVSIHQRGSGLSAAVLREGSGSSLDYFDAEMVLWGNNSETVRDGFTLLAEGQQGLRHAVPLGNIQSHTRPRLIVRHYIDFAGNCAYIKWSRLCDLKG